VNAAGHPVNPFIWTGPIPDGVSRSPFTEDVCRTLKGGTHCTIFGPRGTGKTTFLAELGGVLASDHGPDSPPWMIVRINLQRAVSLPAFIGAVSDAVAKHPDRGLRRRARAGFGRVEKEIGVNLGVVKAGTRSKGLPTNEEEVLHAQLAVLPSLASHIVVAFDEFQRLANCPGDPLSIIRSALMEPEHTGKVSLLLTGSLRERLELMLHTDTEPIWDQTHDLELPPLAPDALADFIQDRFEATGKPALDSAVELLVDLTEAHPKRTQHLAWNVWNQADVSVEIDQADVHEVFESLVAGGSETEFSQRIDALLSGDESDVNDARTLFLIATGGRHASEEDVQAYGLSRHSATRAVHRLKDRGTLVESPDGFRVADPIFSEWLRRNDPLL
jgi:energy-coupling factor transporter ATP-binding protein EcfA2